MHMRTNLLQYKIEAVSPSFLYMESLFSPKKIFSNGNEIFKLANTLIVFLAWTATTENVAISDEFQARPGI